MAWALMESKVHNARSRNIARALLRRAVALNPAKNSPVLKWAVFKADFNWVEAAAAGEAAVEAVRSALAPSSSRAEAAAVTSSSAGAKRSPRRKTTRAVEKEEIGFSAELLELCRTKKALQQPRSAAAVPAAVPTETATPAVPSARFEELAGELERRGGGAEGSGRELIGSWRLVFTTCEACDRVLTRSGASSFISSSWMVFGLFGSFGCTSSSFFHFFFSSLPPFLPFLLLSCLRSLPLVTAVGIVPIPRSARGSKYTDPRSPVDTCSLRDLTTRFSSPRPHLYHRHTMNVQPARYTSA